MSQAQALYRLQKLDLDIEARRSRGRAITAALEQDETLRQAQAEVQRLEADLRPQEAHLTDLNLEIKTVSEQFQQLNQRLYGGSVTNPKELEDIQNKMTERQRRRAALEDQLLETMIAVDDLRAALTTAAEQVRQVEASYAVEHEALSAELATIKRELKQLKAERTAAESDIHPDNLALYQDLRAKKAGHAVALLSRGVCSACGVGQTTMIVQRLRQDHGLVFCSSCGRILVMM